MSSVDGTDAPHYKELLRLLGEVEGWLARIDPRVDHPQPAPGSPLCADDERTDPYQLSHAAWHSLSHAVDHLHCVRTLLRDAGVIHMFAPYSLVRSALENASAAVWLLRPTSRSERIGRRLRFAAVDIRNGEEAKRLTGQIGPRSEQEQMDQLREIAKRAGVDEAGAVRRVGYKEIIQDATSTLVPGPNMILFSWRMCSGMTHGDLWPTLGVSERVELPGAPSGIGTFKITANVQALMYVTAFAIHLTRQGWQLYDQRSRPPY